MRTFERVLLQPQDEFENKGANQVFNVSNLLIIPSSFILFALLLVLFLRYCCCYIQGSAITKQYST